MNGNKEAIRLWCEALESGQYVQRHGALREDLYGARGYCCLGVAAEVAKVNGINVPDSDFTLCVSLPSQVETWLELSTDPNIRRGDTGAWTTCVEANDCLRWDFNQIAAALRATYLTDRVDSDTTAQ